MRQTYFTLMYNYALAISKKGIQALASVKSQQTNKEEKKTPGKNVENRK